MKCCQRFFDRPFSFRHFYSDWSYHVINIEFCCWEAPQCTQVWRYEVCKWVLLLWRDVLWLGLWFVTPGPRSWRGQDEKLRAGRQRTVNRDNFSQSGRRSVNLRTNVWTFWVEHTKSQRLWCFCVMPMLWPWPPVLWWQCGLSHLVVTNKSNKNPQLIRSDSVQNSFFSLTQYSRKKSIQHIKEEKYIINNAYIKQNYLHFFSVHFCLMLEPELSVIGPWDNYINGPQTWPPPMWISILFNFVLSLSYYLYKWPSVTTWEYPYSSQCNFHWSEYGSVFFILTPATRVSMKNTLSYSHR